MPPPNNSVAIRVVTTIILALFALWWSVAFSSVFLVSRHFFSLSRDDRGSLDLDRVRSLRLAYSFGVITRAMLLM
ncbi:hypothetical protein B0H14DRAFT_2852002 [Mycena olivaceomarginata]|nr:hypothetical protein B0H14DRAFT_2852002 [Mycena olivaceomarginata]